jgi:HTH-type transcriptional regulator/antitoxin HigA
MNIKTLLPIVSEDDYNAALAQVEEYFDHEPARGTAEAHHFDALTTLIERYEEDHWRIDPPSDPIKSIEAFMDLTGRSQTDLAELLNSRSRASELLNRRRPLTLEMIVKLIGDWDMPPELLFPKRKKRKRTGLGAHAVRGRVPKAHKPVAKRSGRSVA